MRAGRRRCMHKKNGGGIKEIYNFHFISGPTLFPPPPLSSDEQHQQKRQKQQQQEREMNTQKTSSADGSNLRNHFHMKINLRAHHYVELFENKFCTLKLMLSRSRSLSIYMRERETLLLLPPLVRSSWRVVGVRHLSHS
jgi:hypothetical protein